MSRSPALHITFPIKLFFDMQRDFFLLSVPTVLLAFFCFSLPFPDSIADAAAVAVPLFSTGGGPLPFVRDALHDPGTGSGQVPVLEAAPGGGADAAGPQPGTVFCQAGECWASVTAAR